MFKKPSLCLCSCFFAIILSMSVSASEIDPSWWRGVQAPSVSVSVVNRLFDGLMTGYDLGMFLGVSV